MVREEIAMNNINQLNTNFINLLDRDLDLIRKKLKIEEAKKEQLQSNKRPIDHSEVLEIILNNIEEVDFREEAGDIEESEKLKYKDFLVPCSDKVLETADACGLGICNSRENVYLFNGEYWNRVSNHTFYTFLGAAALKMGLTRNTSKLYTFREQVAKQLLSVAKKYDDYSFNNTDNNSNEKILINLLNGTFEIDGYDMRLKKPEKDDFLTYQLPFKYDENAECPIFDEYLNTVLPDKNNQKILMEYLGYIFVRTNALKLEKTLLLYGTGANGKSVLFEIINALLGGSNNVSNYSLQNLTNENGYYRAMLGNKLVNYASEINGKMDVSIFKQLVSGEPVDARLPYGEPFTLTNYGKLIFNCNQLPTSVENTHAFFRRFLIIPFEVTIPKEKQDKKLAQKIIKSELSGVLNRVLEGLKRILEQESFTESDSSDLLLNNYKKESDSVAQFIEEEGYEKSASKCVPLGNLYMEYRTFCMNSNCSPVPKRPFANQLRDLGINIERRKYGLAVFIKNVEKNCTPNTPNTPF